MNIQKPQTAPTFPPTTSPAGPPLASLSEPLSQSPLVDSLDPAAQALAPLDTSAAVPAAINATQLAIPHTGSSRHARRNGRVACLPRPQRDMVNRMLWNSVPYKNIVAALDNAGFKGISERNISNWFSGGYLEWSLAQEQALENSLQQDHLLSFLRRDDAPELPEVGLQAAATHLSQVLLQKLARADDPEAHLDDYSKLVDLLCRLNRELAATQSLRNESRRKLGRHSDPDRIRAFDEFQTTGDEKFYSDPPPDSGLQKPSVTPFLLMEPTSDILERQDREDQQVRREQHMALFRSMAQPATPVPPANTTLPKPLPPTSNPAPAGSGKSRP